MPSYEYTRKAEKAAQAKAKKLAARAPIKADVGWVSQAAMTRAMISSLRNNSPDPESLPWLNKAYDTMIFSSRPTARELRDRRALCANYLSYAFKLTTPRS